jgi:nucleotide-binding universal stress UspA family protein
MYTKILLPLDGSDLSREAIPHAAALAKLSGASVVLLQVVDSEAQMISQASGVTIEPLPAGQITVEIAREAVAAQRRSAEANLDAAKQRLAEEGVTSVTGEIREGSAGDVIVDAVKDLGCDVVVIATHGRSGLKRALLGSVADHVARHTPSASVLLVRPEAARK